MILYTDAITWHVRDLIHFKVSPVFLVLTFNVVCVHLIFEDVME